jgi:polyisoprenoid-binding protein YceI
LGGASVDVALSGDLTIHGVTRSVTIAGQARLNGDRIEIVASLTFPFSDFGMTPPDIAGFVQVEDEATLEVLLSLEKVPN